VRGEGVLVKEYMRDGSSSKGCRTGEQKGGGIISQVGLQKGGLSFLQASMEAGCEDREERTAGGGPRTLSAPSRTAVAVMEKG